MGALAATGDIGSERRGKPKAMVRFFYTSEDENGRDAVMAVPSADNQTWANVRTAAAELKIWDAVAIIGAGTSVFTGFPLTYQLGALLHHGITADSEASNEWASKVGSESMSTMKTLFHSDSARPEAAFRIISRHPGARYAFQRAFAKLNKQRSRRNSPAHSVLAELLHRRIITKIISLNWDTRLEVAYKEKYGSILHSGSDWLIKPHGDANDPSSPWVFPHDVGSISEELIADLERLANERPRVLLLVGYSEQDEQIVQRIIKPLEDRWRVCRVGPNSKGELAIDLRAEEAMPMLLDALELPPEVPGWDYVRFDGQRDLGSALAGRGLAPADAASCPRLPETVRLRQVVDVTGNGVLVGGPGTGKSITCYQVAMDLNHEGWEVVQLREDTGVSEEALVTALMKLPRPTVVLIDNAQRLSRQFLRNVLGMASPRLRVIVATTDPLPFADEAIEIGAKRAVSVLAEDFRKRENEILPIIRALDDRVGEGYLDESLSDRIKFAESSAKTPWEFTYSLAGGWQRGNDFVAFLRDHERADLLLAAIATRQIATLDSAVDPTWLYSKTSVFQRDREWIESALRLLVERRAILMDPQGNVRCPHVRFAEVVLRKAFKLPKDEEWGQLIELVRTSIGVDAPPILGAFRLLFELSFADGLRLNAGDLFDDRLLHELLDRCWSAVDGRTRGAAAHLLMTLLRWRKERVLESLRSNIEKLAEWVDEAESDSAYGLGWLINDIHNSDPKFTVQLARLSSPIKMARRLSAGPVREWMLWRNLVNILGFDDDWRSKFSLGLDGDNLIGTIDNLSVSQSPYFNYMAKIVYRVDNTLALRLVNSVSSVLANAISRSPAQMQQELRDIIWFVMGYSPNFLRQRQPETAQRRVAREIVRALGVRKISKALSDAPKRDWEPLADLLAWIREVDVRVASRIISMIDFEKLERRTEGKWGKFPPRIEGAISGVSDRIRL